MFVAPLGAVVGAVVGAVIGARVGRSLRNTKRVNDDEGPRADEHRRC